MTHTDATRTGPYHWNNVQDVPGQAFICGYCSVDVGSGKGYLIEDGSSAFIRVCPRCNSPSFFGLDGSQWPGPKVGANVVNLPPDVQAIHEEARNAIAANAPTGSAMLSQGSHARCG